MTAVVENADALSWKEFADASRARIQEARDGKDQANEAAAATPVSNGAAAVAAAPVTNGTAPEPAAAPAEPDEQTEDQPAAGLSPVEEPAPTA